MKIHATRKRFSDLVRKGHRRAGRYLFLLKVVLSFCRCRQLWVLHIFYSPTICLAWRIVTTIIQDNLLCPEDIGTISEPCRLIINIYKSCIEPLSIDLRLDKLSTENTDLIWLYQEKIMSCLVMNPRISPSVEQRPFPSSYQMFLRGIYL